MARTAYKYGYSGRSDSRFDGWRDWFSDNRKWGWDHRGDDDAPSSPTGNNAGSGDDDAPSSPTGNNGSGDDDTPSSPSGNGSGGGDTTTPPPGVPTFAYDLLELTNDYRAEHGVKPLTWNMDLFEAAQGHTQDMADKNYFSHTQPDGDTLSARLGQAGYDYGAAGENIGMGYDLPEEVMKGWIASTGHRENLLNTNYTEFGAGYVDDTRDLWTQVFASPETDWA